MRGLLKRAAWSAAVRLGLQVYEPNPESLPRLDALTEYAEDARSIDDDRRHGRAEEHRHRQHRVPVGHLDVEADVRPEVTARDDWERDALQAVDGERDDHDDGASAPGGDASLEPG